MAQPGPTHGYMAGPQGYGNTSPPGGGYPPAGGVPSGGGYPPPGAPPGGGYPPHGAPPGGGYPPPGAPPGGGYPPHGAPPGGGYPPPGAPPAAGYPPPGGAPLAGGYPPHGAPPGCGYPPPGGAPPPGGNPPEGFPADGMLPEGYEGSTIPTAPPLGKMDNIEGYSGASFDGAHAPPPNYDEAMNTQPQPERTAVKNIPDITEDTAREALLQEVANHCCWGKGAAEGLKIRDIKASPALHYTLETFTETRSTAWAHEAYTGQLVDGPMNGPAPGPWDMAVQPNQKFADTVAQCEVPHTASVKPCHVCIGMCNVRCHHCGGRGWRHRARHGNDRGPTTTRCIWCHGYGQVPCKTCDARGQLKCFIRLTINWKNHLEDHIEEHTDMPDELIRTVSGQSLFEEEHPLVWPVNHFPVQTINIASKQLVDKHRSIYRAERILLQRHQVRNVPVYEVEYQYKAETDTYFVFGLENKAHVPNYPQTCCWGCVIQ